MTDKKISELASNGTLTGSELVELVQGGSNVNALLSAIKTFITTGYLTSATAASTYATIAQAKTEYLTIACSDETTELNGKLSIARSSINLVNDGTFFLGDNDSFFNAEIKIWIFLDDVANIQKIFNGKITDLKISGNKKVSISFEEQTSGLAEPCYLGDVENEIYTNDVNTDPNRKGLPIPFVFGTASKYELAAVNTDESVMIPESMMEATCISFSTNIGGTTNRIWTACRSTYFGYNSFQITGVDNSNPNYTIVSTTSNPDFNDVLVGDTVTVNTTNFRVTKKDSATNKIYMKPKFVGLAVNDWFFRWEVSVIIVDDTGAKFYPDTSHYTYSNGSLVVTNLFLVVLYKSVVNVVLHLLQCSFILSSLIFML